MRFAITFITTIFLVVGCSVEPSSGPTLPSLSTYLDSRGINPSYTASGLGYTINDAGGVKPFATSTVRVALAGKLTNDDQFVQSDGVYFNLSDAALIQGIREGVQLIGAGGSAQLYVPSSLAFGSAGSDGVPANADVIYDIDLDRILISTDQYIQENNITIDETTTSGASIQIIEEGDGPSPTGNSTVVAVRYKGYFTDGQVFDESSVEPSQFSLANVIVGWQELLPLMKEGGKAVFYIPYGAAYGENGFSSIPGRTDLIFEIDLIDVL